jgi:hypothetical protein
MRERPSDRHCFAALIKLSDMRHTIEQVVVQKMNHVHKDMESLCPSGRHAVEGG